MLGPEYLDRLPEPLVKLWQQAEEDILRDAARRIGKMGTLTPTADWQLWRREQIRLCRREVLAILSKYSGKSDAQLREIFRKAAAEALAGDDRLYRSAGLDPPDPNDDPALLNLLNAGYQQTAGSWQNLTATTAQTVSGQFEAALDRAWLQVSSGAFDYTTAVRRAVNGLAGQMAGVTYPTGHRDTLEVAVRRAVLTGVNQTAGKLQLARMEEMGWEYLETTAHAGARPSHAKWQGRQFHRGGAVTHRGRHYPHFEKETGYGTGGGIFGWNCRHGVFPIDPDLDPAPAWSEEELAALEAKTIEYRGKRYSAYEISQKQRALERRVRAAKKAYLAEDAAGLDTTQSAVKLKTARQSLAQFIRDTGGRDDSARTFVSGFGRSQAGRAAAQAKKNTLTNAAGQTIIRVQKTSLTGTPGSVTQVVNAKGGIDRNYYGPDGRQVKQISNNGHGHKKEEALGQHGEHAHDYRYTEEGKLLRPARELTDQERKENADIL